MTRLATGGAVNRQRPLNFRFNGRRYQGLEGDTLASALVVIQIILQLVELDIKKN